MLCILEPLLKVQVSIVLERSQIPDANNYLLDFLLFLLQYYIFDNNIIYIYIYEIISFIYHVLIITLEVDVR